MSKSERFENMQGRILPNFDESTSRILVDDELIAAFLYINSYGSMHERFPFEVTPAAEPVVAGEDASAAAAEKGEGEEDERKEKKEKEKK